jgi:pilus assembly protein Flp/PilA
LRAALQRPWSNPGALFINNKIVIRRDISVCIAHRFIGSGTLYRKDIPMVRSFFAKEDGQGLVEYALILVLIAIVVIGILSILGTKVSTVFSSINSGLS